MSTPGNPEEHRLWRPVSTCLTLVACAWLVVAAIPDDFLFSPLGPVVRGAQSSLDRFYLAASHDVFEGRAKHHWAPSHHCWRFFTRTADGQVKLSLFTGQSSECARPSLRMFENEGDLLISGLLRRYVHALTVPDHPRGRRALDRLQKSKRIAGLARWLCRRHRSLGEPITRVAVALDWSRRNLRTGQLRRDQAVVYNYDCLARKPVEGLPKLPDILGPWRQQGSKTLSRDQLL